MASILNGLEATCSPVGPITISSFICLDSAANQADTNQFRLATAAGDVAIGVSQQGSNNPPNLFNTLTAGSFNPAQAAANPGDQFVSYNVGDVSVPLVLGAGGATAGAALTWDASGHGVMVAWGSGTRYGAIAQTSGAAGDMISVILVQDKA